jgi:hypothetical protein
MHTYHVMLAVPEYIHQGLQNGSLVRNAAGVIRHAIGPNKGNIVAHLREAAPVRMQEAVGPSSPSGDLLASNMATLALQAATMAYLQVRFDAIEHQLTQVLRISQDTYAAVRKIRDFQYLDYATMWVRGFEALQRFQDGGGHHHLKDACRAFRDAIADLKRLLMTHDGEQLLGTAAQIELLLRLAAAGAAAEIQALTLAKAPAEEQAAALRSHRQFWSEFLGRLEDVPPPTRRFPTLEMLRSGPMGHLERQRRWQFEATTLIETFDVENFLLKSASTRLQEVAAWLQAPADAAKPLCLLVEAPASTSGR